MLEFRINDVLEDVIPIGILRRRQYSTLAHEITEKLPDMKSEEDLRNEISYRGKQWDAAYHIEIEKHLVEATGQIFRLKELLYK